MIDFTIKPDAGDEYEVTATARDVVVWERITKGSLTSLKARLRMTDMYVLAHVASKRTGQFTASLAEFEAGVDLDFEADGDDENHEVRCPECGAEFVPEDDDQDDEEGSGDPTRPAP